MVQDREALNLAADRGVAVREFRMAPRHGFADYLLFVDGQAAGVVEANPRDTPCPASSCRPTGTPPDCHPGWIPRSRRYVGTGPSWNAPSLECSSRPRRFRNPGDRPLRNYSE